MLTEEYCLRNELQKMENGLWNLNVKGTNMVGYTKQFQELALLCPNKEAIRMAHNLMGQVMRVRAAKNAENKRKWETIKGATMCNNLTKDRIWSRLILLGQLRNLTVGIDVHKETSVERIYENASIDERPFKIGKFRETLAEGALHLGPERDRFFANLSPKEKERFKADIRATNILLQGLPKDVYTLINNYTDAKDIWDNVKMLLEGSENELQKMENGLWNLNVKGTNMVGYTKQFQELALLCPNKEAIRMAHNLMGQVMRVRAAKNAENKRKWENN
ncbi:hypothetical protein Tco_0718189 [Tanacetum coccineum]